jgi:hypothetical protein
MGFNSAFKGLSRADLKVTVRFEPWLRPSICYNVFINIWAMPHVEFAANSALKLINLEPVDLCME